MSKYRDMNQKITLTDGEKERLIASLSVKRKKAPRWTGVAVAAAICLLAVLGVFAVKDMAKMPHLTPDVPPSEQTGENTGVYVPKTEIDIGDGTKDSMVAFIVYNGRVYMGGSDVYHEDDVRKNDGCIFDEYADISQKLRYRSVPFTVTDAQYTALLGDFLDTCTDTPDMCKSEADRQRVRKAFEDPSGESFFGMPGDYYAVNGMPVEKCICYVSRGSGCRSILPLYCLNGVTLYSGRDVFGDLLDLENALRIQWITDEAWNEGLDVTVYYHDGETPGAPAMRELTVSPELLNGFLEELYASEPVVRSEKTYEAFEKEMYAKPSGHLYFTLNNGLLVRLRLYDNGYASFDGSFDLLFRLSGEAWQELLKAIR